VKYSKGQILVNKKNSQVYKIICTLKEGQLNKKVADNIENENYLPCQFAAGNNVMIECYYIKLCKLDNFLNTATDDCTYIRCDEFDKRDLVEAKFPLGYIFYSPKLGQAYISKYRYSDLTNSLTYEAVIVKNELSFANKLEFTEDRLSNQKAYSIKTNDIISAGNNVYKIEYIKPTEKNWTWSSSKIIHLKYIGLAIGVKDEDVSYCTLIERYNINNTEESKKALLESLSGDLQKVEKSFDMSFVPYSEN
jgi:hypothetical protein